MTCVMALKLRDENGPRLAVQVPLFPEAAFPADTLAASENRTGLYLESNGIFDMVRNLVKNTDDVRHPYITPRTLTPAFRPRSWSPTASIRCATSVTPTPRSSPPPATT